MPGWRNGQPSIPFVITGGGFTPYNHPTSAGPHAHHAISMKVAFSRKPGDHLTAARNLSPTAGLLQRGGDVVAEGDGYIGSSTNDPAEPGDRGGHQQAVGDLVV